MIRLILLIAIHAAVCFVIHQNMYSEPVLVSDRGIPGLEECSSMPNGLIDGPCMDRNDARIQAHMRAYPLDSSQLRVSPMLSPLLTVVLGFYAWNAARKMKSRWGVYVAAAGYGIGTLFGFFNLLDVFALIISALAVLVLHLSRK
jgi:hypothetical protein